MIIGTVKDDGHAYVRVKIKGPLRADYIEIEAMIDTGFSGFLSVPFDKGVDAGLVLETYIKVRLADERVVFQVGCLGQAKIENKGESYEKVGLILLGGKGTAIIGQRFLTSNDLILWLDAQKRKVTLVQRNTLPLEQRDS